MPVVSLWESQHTYTSRFLQPRLNVLSRGDYDLVIVILLSSLLLLGIIVVGIFFLRRHRRQKKERIRDMEEGMIEVQEARAKRFDDDSLKGPCPGKMERSLSLPSNSIFGDFDIPSNVVPHPLFNPGIKRSRSIDSRISTRSAPNHVSRQASSNPTLQRKGSNFSAVSLPYSFSSYLGKSTPMLPSTTMQTRVPEVANPSPVLEIHKKNPIPRDQVRSVWSFSAASTISASSIYPEDEEPVSPRGRPISPRSPQGLVPVPQPIRPPHPGDLVTCYDYDTLPNLESLQPPQRCHTKSLPPVPPPRNGLHRTPSQPSLMNRSSSFSRREAFALAAAGDSFTRLLREQYTASASQSTGHSPDHSATPDSELTIERWLDGSTPLERAFESILGDNMDRAAAASPSIDSTLQSSSLFGRSLSDEESKSVRGSRHGMQWIGAAF